MLYAVSELLEQVDVFVAAHDVPPNTRETVCCASAPVCSASKVLNDTERVQSMPDRPRLRTPEATKRLLLAPNGLGASVLRVT